MKIAMLTKYGDLAASTRQRFTLYREHLEGAGFILSHQPLLDDEYLSQLYRGASPSPMHVMRLYGERLRWLLSSPDVDLVWLHCELFPYMPGPAERLVQWPRKPVVFDFDDAIFHNYDLHRNRIVRALLGKRLHTSLGVAELAFCGNAYLADYARQHCRRVEIVPTVVDLAAYDQKADMASADRLTVGWIGTPSTWNAYVAPMLPLLTRCAAEADARILAVGAGHGGTAHPLLDIEPWSEASEDSLIQRMSIGIMPLADTPWARGKCGYKLIQYMACGLPVVASPVGVNADIVKHGVNGFLAETEEEWHAAIAALLDDPDLRRRMGAAGRRTVEADYALATWGPRVAAMLREAAVKGRGQ
jgi:glycosyltransferase involved in cell wall biosynthesis